MSEWRDMTTLIWSLISLLHYHPHSISLSSLDKGRSTTSLIGVFLITSMSWQESYKNKVHIICIKIKVHLSRQTQHHAQPTQYYSKCYIVKFSTTNIWHRSVIALCITITKTNISRAFLYRKYKQHMENENGKRPSSAIASGSDNEISRVTSYILGSNLKISREISLNFESIFHQ